jgi:hypothetical protein
LEQELRDLIRSNPRVEHEAGHLVAPIASSIGTAFLVATGLGRDPILALSAAHGIEIHFVFGTYLPISWKRIRR